MKKIVVLAALAVIMLAGAAGAQETSFGKNKVQYRRFNWQFIQTEHFDIYFYDGEYDLAKFTAEHLEPAYKIVTDQLRYYVKRRIPVFVYNSHNDFVQTNVSGDVVSEGVQGFTEVFKNRMVIHFNGSYEEFRHLMHHELTHAVIYDLLYGQFFKAMLSPNRLFSLPLWFAEGYAEYSSHGGWEDEADMMVRDATVNNYLLPPDDMGFFSYTQGYALVKYIVDNYGIEKLGEILGRGRALMTMDKALKSAIGLDTKELYEKFSKEMKKRYWPEISRREEPKDFAKQLTNHEKDGSDYNEKPVFSPNGQELAMFTDRNGFTEIFLISAIDGKKIARLVKGERNAELESLRWYTSGMSFSPKGDRLVFVSKSKGEDAINFLTIKNKNIYLSKKFGLKSIISPAWSPDGKSVAFTALSAGMRDLYLYNLETDSVKRLTTDRYDDVNVNWFPDGRRLIFSSDRPHPDNHDAIGDTTAFAFGSYNLHILDLESGQISPVPAGPGQNLEPVVAPDGKKIAFISDRNGINNIYIYYPDSSRVVAVTNILSGAQSPTWSPDSKMIAFSTFNKAGYDVYLIKDIVFKGDNGRLIPTDLVLGKYDNKVEWARYNSAADTTSHTDSLFHAAPPPPQDPDLPGASLHASGWQGAISGDTTKPAVPDTMQAAADTAKIKAEKPKAVADSTKAKEDEEQYIYRAPRDSSAFRPEGELGQEGPPDSLRGRHLMVDSLQAAADSLDNKLPTGEYKIRPYKTKFTPDYVNGGLLYDSFFGFRGQTLFVFSDYLGDHQFVVATDLINTIDQSNVQVYYFYNKLPVDFGLGIFHTKNYYVDSDDNLFSDRFYGILGTVSWPRSMFTRIEFSTSALFIDRRYYDSDLSGRHVHISNAVLSWIHDTVLWGITGPVNGRRYKLSLETTTPLFGDSTSNYYAAEMDYRQYFPLVRPFTFAFRMSGAFSGGSHPKNYYLGGSTNRIGTVSVGSSVYEVENLYFASVVTPLRGYDYYELVGTRYALANLELHFPFIDYFIMRYPLHLGLSRITGALFVDYGAAWDKEHGFKGATSHDGTRLVDIKSGFGFGARANLGFLILRYDLAWRTDYHTIEPHTHSYFSLGTDF